MTGRRSAPAAPSAVPGAALGAGAGAAAGSVPGAARSGGRRTLRATADVLLLAIAVAVALIPLQPVYGGTVLLAPVLGGGLLGAGTAAASARRRWSALTTTVALLLVGTLAGGPLATPARTPVGLLPTAGSVTDLVRGAARGWKDVLTLQPPLGGSGWLLVPPYLLALVGTALAVRIALGRDRTAPAAALVPPVVLAGAVLLGTHRTVLPATVGTALAVLLLVWASWRAGRSGSGRLGGGRSRGGGRGVRRPVALLALVAVAAGAGLVAAPLLAERQDRYVLRDALVPPFDLRDQASPLSAFRAYVKDDDSRALFTVTGLPAGARIRLATLDRYDGVVWDVAGGGSSSASGEFRRVGAVLSADAEAAAGEAVADGGTRVQVEVEIDDLDGVWLPTVGDAVSIDLADAGTASQLRFNDATGAAVLTGGLVAGTRYTLDTVVPAVPDDEQMAGAQTSDLDLPELLDVPDAVVTAAADAVRDAQTPAEVARALEQALAEGGYFSHGITGSGDYPSLSGHGADRMTALLAGDLMVGDDEQYASAMALMAREVGLPARVVLGFVPGDDDSTASTADGSDGSEGPVVVTGRDVRAWVEISFVGHGWVAFDPTPPQDQTPQEEQQTSPADPEPQVVQPPPPPADPVQAPEDDAEQPQTQDSVEPAPNPVWTRIVGGAAAGAGVLLLLRAPAVAVAALKAHRRRRRRRAGAPAARVAGGWQEVLDLAVDLRRPVAPAATRRESAVALAAGCRADPVPGAALPLAEGVRTLAEQADAVVFGLGEPTADQARQVWEQVDVVLAGMRAASTRRERWRLRISTRSLRGSRRQGSTAAGTGSPRVAGRARHGSRADRGAGAGPGAPADRRPGAQQTPSAAPGTTTEEQDR
ncbi:MAG TPA: transglutaminaseTgpA domain-containing protein [Cellulomonas sp.]